MARKLHDTVFKKKTCRGSKILIEGKNLDSVYRTVVRFKPNESHLKPVTRVLWASRIQ